MFSMPFTHPHGSYKLFRHIFLMRYLRLNSKAYWPEASNRPSLLSAKPYLCFVQEVQVLCPPPPPKQCKSLYSTQMERSHTTHPKPVGKQSGGGSQDGEYGSLFSKQRTIRIHLEPLD